MAARILTELSVGLTPEIHLALESAVAFSGVKASVYGRIALVEKLCRENFLTHPGVAFVEAQRQKNTEVKPAA